MPYPRVDPALAADGLEKQLLATWKHEQLFEETARASRYGPPFVFFEGPPTANGRPGIHHVFARTIKDLICRYHTMLGRAVTRIAGWDTHGLPVEIEVERALGISGKKQIEAYGIDKFNRLCRESVFAYKTDWEALSERIGYWLDYEHPYITYASPYIETVWWLLKRLHDKALLYRGHKVLPYCPRCGTALSSHELALGYETVTTNSVYVAFPSADAPRRQFVVWTTTPWTLVSNVGLAVNPDLEYGEYDVEGTRYVVATARAADVHVGGRPLAAAPQVAVYQGQRLVGERYARPLAVVALPVEGRSGVIVPAAFVSAEDGSGIVHLAPAFGADDFQAAQQHGLALVNPVASDGTSRRDRVARTQRSPRDRQGHQPADHRSAEAGGPLARDEAVRAQLPVLLAVRLGSHLLCAGLLVRADNGAQSASARNQRADRLASGGSRDRALRGVAREQRRLGAVSGSLLGHAPERVAVRPRARAPRSHRFLRRTRRTLGASPPDGFRPAPSLHRCVQLGVPLVPGDDAPGVGGYRRVV